MPINDLIDALIDREGGYVNHSADRGGPTNFGVTEAVARAHGYRGGMRDLPRSEAAAIYKRLYWLRPKLDQVAKRSESLAAELFDTGVNMGPAVAATFSSARSLHSIATARTIPTSYPTDGSGLRRCRRWTPSSNFAAGSRARPFCCARSMRSRASATSVSPNAAPPMRRSFMAG
jgi:hypothetical protein